MHTLFSRISKKQIEEHRLSVAALVAANCVPLLGVLLFGWSTFQIVLLYWFENVVLGVLNVLKMLACSPDALTKEEKAAGLSKQSAKFFFVPFFTLHYGLFCAVHGVFVFVLLGGNGPFSSGPPTREQLSPNLLIAAVAFAGSHLVSFFANYLGKGENLRTSLPQLMAAPYPRIVVLHIAIVLGAFATIALGSPVLLLAILIVGKTLLDLNLHLREHDTKKAPADPPVLTTVERK